MGISKGKWQEQLKAAQASGMSLVGYAAQHSINVRCLYDARHAAAKARVQPFAREAAFVRVKPIRARTGAQAVRVQQGGAPGALLVQARLGNGVVLSWTQDGQNAHAQANLPGAHAGGAAMFRLNPGQAVYLHRDAIDFRKNINGLASLVEHGLGMDAFAHAVFVFGNRRKDRIKILGWERNASGCCKSAWKERASCGRAMAWRWLN